MVDPCISAAQGAIPGFLNLDVRKYLMLLGTQEEIVEAMFRYLFLSLFIEGWLCCLLHFTCSITTVGNRYILSSSTLLTK